MFRFSDYRNKNTNYCGAIFSFGAGVQSTAIMLLLKHEEERVLEAVGHLPKCAIFADTGAELSESLENFEYWRKHSPIPLFRVKNWKTNAINNPADMPVFLPSGGFTHRTCTHKWKLQPIFKASRNLYPKQNKNNPCAMWLGISTDEITRMKQSNEKCRENIYPLIELGLSRQDCYSIIKKYGHKANKSSCYMCPYQVKRWAENKDIDKAIAYEKELQKQLSPDGTEKAKYREVPYLHPSCEPLDIAVQKQLAQGNLFTFDDECDGYCGL